nr:subtilisin-like protease SBT1.1 [Ipomoea trifida]
MANYLNLVLNFLCIACLHFSAIFGIESEIYIVHVELPEGLISRDSHYQSFMRSAVETSTDSSNIIYSYQHVISGFAAKLSPDAVKAMEKMDGFVYARPQRVLNLQTTHTPDFLGLHLNSGFWNNSNYGEGVIIGVLDTGVSPEHPSFNDDGMPPPPAKWKGKCDNFECNNKLIGAKSFRSGNQSTSFDYVGHGTHTSSTAAGNFVGGANVYGSDNGTAAGIAPRAHLAMYKVCGGGCPESDLLAGMDAAIEDGVDVVSISLGGPSGPFYDDVIALATYRAMEKGIFVSCAAGNSGPNLSTVLNEAPWILTVGAATVDRNVVATARLGNGEEVDGQSAYQPDDFSQELLPLVYPGMNTSDFTAKYCDNSSLEIYDVKGKVVVCDMGDPVPTLVKGIAVKEAGGAAMILVNQDIQGYTTFADPHVLPATHLSFVDGEKVKAYINSTSNPIATILFKGTVIGDPRAPAVSYFSSRGPGNASPGILKPDIVGPGVSIIAAWPVSVENRTGTKSTFNIISGTSMSCPHLSGVAALLKSAHPDWSPAAIKSAIITTADTTNLGNNKIEDQRRLPADIFTLGAGQVNPSRANDPGLVYDVAPEDYVPYLCGLGYTDKQVGLLLQRNVTCSATIPEAELNYPSFSLRLLNTFGSQKYTRTVTNVGEASSSYTVKIVPPDGVSVTVEPPTLNFSELNQKASYRVTFTRSASPTNATVVEGYLKWRSSRYVVRSPIAAILNLICGFWEFWISCGFYYGTASGMALRASSEKFNVGGSTVTLTPSGGTILTVYDELASPTFVTVLVYVCDPDLLRRIRENEGPGSLALDGLTWPAPSVKMSAGRRLSSSILLFTRLVVSEVVMIADLIAAGDQSGCALLSKAATPDRCGQDIEVPEIMLNVGFESVLFSTETGQAAMMFTPGPTMSGFRIPGLALLGPRDEKKETAGA